MLSSHVSNHISIITLQRLIAQQEKEIEQLELPKDTTAFDLLANCVMASQAELISQLSTKRSAWILTTEWAFPFSAKMEFIRDLYRETLCQKKEAMRKGQSLAIQLPGGY